jgi:arginyl-tRNA synthetase
MDVKQQIDAALNKIIESLKKENKIDEGKMISFHVDIPRNRDHGDFATNLPFVLAKELRTKPAEIGQLIKERFDFQLAPDIDRIEPAGAGYLNLFVKGSLLVNIVKEIETKNEDFGKSNIGKGQKVLIEFVSANPTGPLNVVSARAASVGDALANVLKAANYSVTKEFYVNDVGTQIYLFGQSLKSRYLELIGKQFDPISENGYHGEYVKELAKDLPEYIKNLGRENLKVGQAYLKEYYDIFFEKPESFPLDLLFIIAPNMMIEKQKKDLEKFGVTFDNWFQESELHKNNRQQDIIGKLKELGEKEEKPEKFIFQEKDNNAKWFRSTLYKDDKDRVLVKSDNSYTYFLNDIAYHQDKFERGFERLIDIWGPDHHGYIARMKAAMQALGHKPEDLEILIVQQVNLLRDGVRIKMSKRAGQIETMEDLINEVGVDAARFFFLMRGSDSHLDFDLEVAKHQTNDNPVFYVQYAHARVCSIFQLAAQRNIPIPLAKDVDLSKLQLPEEGEIIKILAEYPNIMIESAGALEPQRVVRYLMDLSTKLHQYYNQHRVISEDEKLTQARLVLMKVIQIVVKNGLRILGVSAPERM